MLIRKYSYDRPRAPRAGLADSFLAGGSSHHLVPQRRPFGGTPRVFRSGIPGRRRLHGSRQLGHRFGRRRAVRLRASLRHHDFEPDGDSASAFVHQTRRRHRPRSGPGLSRPLSAPVVWFLWILCEIAIAACDLAEVVGSAIALQLLFGIPLVWGCLITALDVLAVLYLQNKGFRYIEALVITLIATIGGCFALELIFSKPSL